MSQIELNYLVFDDDPDAPNQYKNRIKLPGCIINSICIDPVQYFDAESNTFNNKEFNDEILKKTRGRNINLIISDWNIMPAHKGFDGIVGWNVIEMVLQANEKFKSRTFLIYSSDIKKASEYIFSKIKSEMVAHPEDAIPSLEFISKMLNLSIKFCKRDKNRFDEIKTLLSESNTISNIVLDSIISFDQNMVIKTGNSDYDGKKISDILNNSDLNIGGLKFIREFIELSVSHYSEINE